MAKEVQAAVAAFNEAYASLNAAQKEAVDTIEGPVMVIAGPGTGKTQILTLRIANILLKTDTQPENILALTFTESGARAMRERLIRYVGTRAYQVPIFTFHGFAEVLIREYPDAYPKILGGRALTDVERFKLIEELLNDSEVRILRPRGDTRYYVKPIMSALSELKRENIAPDDFSKILDEDEKKLEAIPKIHEKGAHKGKVRSEYRDAEKRLLKNRELLYVYRLYEAALLDMRRYDYDDMIIETVRALENDEDILRDLQETYQYVLADEHQDVNGSQNRILELLASFHDAPNLFVVGDEKQAIFRFQGASLENFLFFEEKFPHTKTIALTENYRSGQRILDASHSLIKVEEGPLADLRVPLHAAHDIQDSITQTHYAHTAVEDSSVVDEIESLISDGVAPEEIAVIVRTNREVEHFAELFRKRSIAAAPSADSDILEHPIVEHVTTLIEAVAHPESDEVLFRLLHAPYWGLGIGDIARLSAERSQSKPLAAVLSDQTILQGLQLEHPELVQRIPGVLENARARNLTEAPQRVIEYLLHESGFLSYVTKEEPAESSRIVRRLYDEIEKNIVLGSVSNLTDIVSMLILHKEHGIPLQAPYISSTSSAVSVMTAHKSKGLEFAHVFVPHATDAMWGKRRSPDQFKLSLTRSIDTSSFDPLDDERRLFYVAMTRAKQSIHFSYSDTGVDNRAFLPSPFLASIDEEYIEVVDNTTVGFDPVVDLKVEAKSTPIAPDFLKEALIKRGLSATALNNYLASPWTYLYRNVFRVPETLTPALQYGNAIHGSLQKITVHHTKHKTAPSDTDIKKMLEQELSKLPLSKEEYVRLHSDGLASLAVSVPQILDSISSNTKEEFTVRASLATGDPAFPEILLTGNLDRIDFGDDGMAIRVIDYKTGKHRTRGEIEGATKNSRGDYKRQLVFYALLLELSGDERYRTRDCSLLFVEPNDKGVIREESYTITDDEIEELKTEIIRVAKEIVTGAFLTTPCDETQSDYCHFVSLLRRE